MGRIAFARGVYLRPSQTRARASWRSIRPRKPAQMRAGNDFCLIYCFLFCIIAYVRYKKGMKMKLKFLTVLAAMFLPFASMAAMPHTGFYQTIDDETSNPKSIVAIYEYSDGDDARIAGRIVALYGEDGKIAETLSNPSRVADKVKGAPKMVGLDIIWGMEWDEDDNEYEDGKIMDPKKGSIYSSRMWQDKKDASKFNVRGKIGPFGRTQVWNVLKTSNLPADLQNLDMSGWTPVVVK
jgi:uncharacterized protein (DUF2147 family)